MIGSLRVERKWTLTVELKVGQRLNNRRREMGISLRKLAKMTGLSASFLSQVERGQTNLSLKSLQFISQALSVPLLYFLAEDERAKPEKIVELVPQPAPERAVKLQDETEKLPAYTPVVRAGDRSKLMLPLSGVVYELLTPSFGQKMVAIKGELSPGTGNVVRRLREPTEEFIFVLSGVLQVGLDRGEYILKSGDTIYFEGKNLQKLICASEKESAVWVSVITPPTF